MRTHQQTKQPTNQNDCQRFFLFKTFCLGASDWSILIGSGLRAWGHEDLKRRRLLFFAASLPGLLDWSRGKRVFFRLIAYFLHHQGVANMGDALAFIAFSVACAYDCAFGSVFGFVFVFLLFLAYAFVLLHITWLGSCFFGSCFYLFSCLCSSCWCWCLCYVKKKIWIPIH